MWLTPSVVRYNTRLSTCMICFVFLSFTKLYGLAILLYGNESHKLTDKSPNPSDTRLIHQRLLPSSLDFPVLQPRRRGQSGASWPRHQIVQAQYIHNVSTITAKIFPKRKKKLRRDQSCYATQTADLCQNSSSRLRTQTNKPTNKQINKQTNKLFKRIQASPDRKLFKPPKTYMWNMLIP